MIDRTRRATVILILAIVLFSRCREEPVSDTSDTDTSGTQVTATETAPEEPPTVVEAQERGTVTVSARGIDVEKMHVQISSSQPGTVVISAGQVFASGSSGTQTMIAAVTTRVVFDGNPGETFQTPQVQDFDVEVYCINRMLDAPTPASEYTIVRGGGELDPVRRLAACLEEKQADHHSRQLAIWLTSDHFLDMTEDDVHNVLHQHNRDLLTSDKGIEELHKAMPDIPEEQLRQIRDMPEFAKLVEEAANKEVDEEIEEYKTKARPLLEQCGVDPTQSKFFGGGTT
jgi:hypothetical protein